MILSTQLNEGLVMVEMGVSRTRAGIFFEGVIHSSVKAFAPVSGTKRLGSTNPEQVLEAIIKRQNDTTQRQFEYQPAVRTLGALRHRWFIAGTCRGGAFAG